jgi:hypothetical protein
MEGKRRSVDEKSRRRFWIGKESYGLFKLKMFVNGLTLQRTCHGVVKSKRRKYNSNNNNLRYLQVLAILTSEFFFFLNHS